MKKILSILMMLMLMTSMLFVFNACSNDDAVAEEVPEEEVVGEEESSLFEMSGLEEDPLGEDLEGLYLMKDDKFYTLDGALKHNNDTGFEPGKPANNGRILYSNAEMYEKSGLWTFYSYGFVPELVLSSESKVVAFSKSHIPSIQLYSIDFYGYGMSGIYHNGKVAIYNSGTDKTTYAENVSDFIVKDEETGEVIEDYYNLAQNRSYIASWHTGTSYEEEGVSGNNSVYAFKPGFDIVFGSQEYEYILEGSLTDFDYAEYDFSEVEPGLYKIAYDGVWRGVLKVDNR